VSKVKKKFEDFIKREAKLVLNGVSPQYQIMLNMAFGTLLRYVQNASDKEIEQRIKEILSKKEQIYQMLNEARDGKLEVKDKKLQKIYPFLQKLLKDEDNVIKKVIDDFFKEFGENEVKDSENG